jgi:hypothetical protein
MILFTYSLSELSDLLPGILPQLGQDNLAQLKRLYAEGAASQAASGAKDDDVPELVENFEAAAKS